MTTEMINSTSTEANISTDDQIANLLMGEPEADTDQSTEAEEDNIVEDIETDESDDAIEAETEEVSEDTEEAEQSLAQHLGLTEDQVTSDDEGNLILNTKVDGKVEALKFKDVLAGFQTSKHNTQKSQALAQERKTFEQQVQARATEIKSQLDTNTALTSQLFNELTAEYNNTDWNTLRATDPAEWSARQSEMTNRHGQLQQIAASIGAQRTQEEANLQAEVAQVQSNYLSSQRDQMIANNPDWNDPEKMKTNLKEIRDFLTDTHGFSAEDMSSIGDSRAISIIQDAMAYRKGKTVADRKIKAVPKSLIKSSGKKANRKLSKLDKLTKAAKSAKGANRIAIQDDAIAALLLG